MRVEGRGFEFRMELGSKVERVGFFREFGDFHEAAVGRGAGKDEPRFFKLVDIFRVHFPSVAVAFGNFG